MTTLALACFSQSTFWPEDTAHWGLFLYVPGQMEGDLFHILKDSDHARRTQLERVARKNPRRSSSLSQFVEVASNLSLTPERLHEICLRIADGRPFDLIVNNCQRFCSEVLEYLVATGWITQAELDALSTKGFRPLVGRMGQSRR
ncbi:hypothetical protein FOMPIDRAFT_1132325 [Fomitopsis schrenkii]|uniref:PPPDE domain-containing protein n=1 Tax=Fomitopsis schrenkii TaxID=2126942 RepID=S8FA44_FOMSC|nr:hypothetical protein FOMPIDRAFT_1132325 [Fomitopsis schrenkii]